MTAERVSLGTSETERLCLVSCDTHIGPSPQKLRPYCEARYLDEFDDFFAHAAERGLALRAGTSQQGVHKARMSEQVNGSGEQDPHARLRDMEQDGVAAEVIFHGSQNDNVMPFGFGGRGDLDLEAVGIRIYNRWLADFCSVYPDQRVGLMQLPAWSPEACVEEVQTGYGAGLRGVNLPAVRPADRSRLLYTSRQWDPFWDICQSLRLPLMNHGASADPDMLREPCPGNYAIASTESGWLARRTVWWLIFTGVFDRYPGLRFVITEQPGEWPRTEFRHLDSAYWGANAAGELGKEVASEPSWYFRHNIWIGGSFLSNFEVRMYLELDMADRVMWGSDYPHIEGTWPNSALSLRKTFEGIDRDTIRRIGSQNAIEVFGLDVDKLSEVARRIGPTMDEVSESLDAVPDGMEFSLAFRESSTFT